MYYFNNTPYYLYTLSKKKKQNKNLYSNCTTYGTRHEKEHLRIN